MASVKFNPLLVCLRGQVGDIVYKMRYGKIYASRKPAPKRRIFSSAQKAEQERFRKGTIYGKMVMADPYARAPYEAAAREQGRPILSLMVADFLHAPSVDEIDLRSYNGQVGSKIVVRATDDFGVTGIRVTISSATCDPIETGAAILSARGDASWVYTGTTSIPIGTGIHVEVTAMDRPGNKTSKSSEWIL